MNTNWVRRGDHFRKYSPRINKIIVLILFYASDADYPINKIKIHIQSRDVTKISSYEVNVTSRRGIKQLGISFGSTFLLFSNESSRRPHSQQPGEIPGPPALNDNPVQRHLTEYGLESNYGLPKCKLQAGFSLGILVAGERCNLTGEYFERGSTSE